MGGRVRAYLMAPLPELADLAHGQEALLSKVLGRNKKMSDPLACLENVGDQHRARTAVIECEADAGSMPAFRIRSDYAWRFKAVKRLLMGAKLCFRQLVAFGLWTIESRPGRAQ